MSQGLFFFFANGMILSLAESQILLNDGLSPW